MICPVTLSLQASSLNPFQLDDFEHGDHAPPESDYIHPSLAVLDLVRRPDTRRAEFCLATLHMRQGQNQGELPPPPPAIALETDITIPHRTHDNDIPQAGNVALFVIRRSMSEKHCSLADLDS